MSAGFSKGKPVENVPPERFQNQGVTSGTQGRSGLVRSFLEKLSLFSPTFSARQEHGAGDFAVCGQRLRGHVPSKNTSPAALSWSSLIGESFSKTFCFYTMLFVFAFFAFPQKKERTQDPLLHSSCFPALTARRPPDLPPPHRDWGYVWSVPD